MDKTIAGSREIKRKVIVVEKSKMIRDMISEGLKVAGYEPVKCVAITDVLEKVAGEESRHIVGMISEADNIEAPFESESIEKIRENGFESLPVLLTAAEAGRDLVVKVSNLGISGILVKPFSGKQISDKAKSVFR